MPGRILKRLPPARCISGMGSRSGVGFVWQLPHAATTFTRYSPRVSNAPGSSANADWENMAVKAAAITKTDTSTWTLTIAQIRTIAILLRAEDVSVRRLPVSVARVRRALLMVMFAVNQPRGFPYHGPNEEPRSSLRVQAGSRSETTLVWG